MASLNIEQWTPEEVSQWVKGLGSQFEGHYQSFVDEEITGKAMLAINADYLEELSIENVNDQNVILEAVKCLHEVDTCLRSETFHGQVVIVNEKTKLLLEQLENEDNQGKADIETSESSVKMAVEVYQLAKKLLSWLIRSPFSEMNACWPLKDSVSRVVRDMTDETLLKNFGYLQENVKKIQGSFDNFLNEKEMQEVFKQPPILKTEEITLEGEGLGICITTTHNIHTVNSVAADSPAGKNKNIKNGDEIVKVNGQCVIAWQQKNVITLMKSKENTVSLTLKKLPLVDGPLNKPVNKPGTPLGEMEVIMDRTRITTERTTRVEMKEAGIKEETSLEMQAIENEEENLKIEERIEEEPAKEEKEAGKEMGKEEEKEGVKEQEKEAVKEEEKGEVKREEEGKAAIKELEKEKETVKEEGKEKEETKETGKEEETVKEEGKEKVEEVKEEEKVDGKKPVEEEKKLEETKKDEEPKGEKTEEKEVVELEKAEEKKEPIVETVEDKQEEVKGSEVETVKVGEKLEGKVEAKEDKKDETTISVITEEEAKTELPKLIESLKTGASPGKETPAEDTSPKETTAAETSPKETPAEETTPKNTPAEETQVEETTSKETQAKETSAEVAKVDEAATKEKSEEKVEKKETTEPVVDTTVAAKEESPVDTNDEAKKEIVEEDKKKESVEQKPEVAESKTIWYDDGEAKPEEKETAKEDAPKTTTSTDVVTTENVPPAQQNGETEQSPPTITVEPLKDSPDKKPARPELPKMKIGSVKTVTVKGANTKQVEIFGTSNVVRREKKVNGAPNKRISCIELGEADCEGWLTKKSGGHGLTPTRWRRQWCVLKEEHLYYYKTSFDREAGGVFEVTDYTVSNAQEIKKPFAFKCEKEGAKKYCFHADNEKDRDMWVKCLNATSRGEKRQKETLGLDLNDGDRKSSVSAAKAQNRGRTSSVLAGIRFNYYDEDDEEGRMKGQQPSSAAIAAKRINDSMENDEKEKKEVEILKVARPVEEPTESCQVIPVDQLGDKGSQGVTEAPSEQKDTSGKDKSEDKTGTVSDSKKVEDKTSVDTGTKSKEDNSGTEEHLGTTGATGESKGQSSCADDATKDKDVGDKGGTKKQVDTSESKEDSKDPLVVPEVKDPKGVESTDDTKSGEGTSQDKGETKEQLDTHKDKVTEVSQDSPKDNGEPNDEFQEVAQSIQAADINIDGTERPSPKEMLRKLSVNSKDEIMDKVVKLRLLKQSLKDKEQSMDVIEELLSSDVTPETITEWRTKFDSVVEQNGKSNDVNENSHL